MAASTGSESTAAAKTSAEKVAGSHVLTIDGYSRIKKLFAHPGSFLQSELFYVGREPWKIELYPSGKKENNADCLVIFLKYYDTEFLKVRFQLTLLTLSREIMLSTQSCYAFSRTNNTCRCYFPYYKMEPDESSILLPDSFHVKCDITVVEEITPIRLPDLHYHFGDLLASHVGADVAFEVCGDVFSAHKCVLATRSTAFMAEFLGRPAGTSTSAVTRVLIDDMEPRVFKALLHFIYTDTLPDEVHEGDDKIVMARGLLVAADRYAMDRLKLICGDMLCAYVKDADKHGCRRLKEACMKLLIDHFDMVAP